MTISNRSIAVIFFLLVSFLIILDYLCNSEGGCTSSRAYKTNQNNLYRIIPDTLDVSSKSKSVTDILDVEKDSEKTNHNVSLIQLKLKSDTKGLTDTEVHNKSDTEGLTDKEHHSTTADATDVEEKYEKLLGCRKLPDILTIGFEKCGTVTVDTFLEIHPMIFMAKEGNYQLFNEDYTISESLVKAYTRNKPCTPPGQLRLRKLGISGTAENTFEVIPNVRLLAIVREPVERAMSHYIHRLEKGLENIESDFDKTVASIMDYNKPPVNSSVLFTQSTYIQKLKPWIEKYGLDKIHIVDGDNLVKDPAQELEQVEKFLGLKPFIKREHFVYSPKKRFYCLKKDKDIECLPERKGRPHPQMSDQTRARLQQYFRPFNDQLFMTTGRNFTWNY